MIDERFPIGQTIGVADGDTPLAIKESGIAGAEKLYDGRATQRWACVTSTSGTS